jgi:hypothetical protein
VDRAAEARMGGPPPGSPLTDMPDAWRALATVSGATAEDLFDPVCFISNDDTDTQVVCCNLLLVSCCPPAG